MSDLEPLDSALAALFAEEKATYLPDSVGQAEVLARVEHAVRLGALGHVPSAAAASLGTKAVVGLAIAIAFGGGVFAGRVTAPRAASPLPVVSASAPSATVTTITTTGGAPSAGPTSEREVPPAAAPTTTVSAARPRDAAPPSDLAREQQLIDTARVALGRGRVREALAATDQHASRFPNGALAEEREALAIQALALDGQSDAANARANRFRRRYPQSIFRAGVDRALSPGSTPPP